MAADGVTLTPQWSAAQVVADRSSVKLALRYALTRAPGIVTITASMFPYDPQHQTFLNIYEGSALTQAILDPGRTRFEYFAGTSRGAVAVARRFLPAGIVHILLGPDHLLFLVGLLLLGGTTRQLVVLVTSFTVAHSLTMSLAALNVVSAPARLIEPAIALSIVYVGADNLLIRDGRDVRAMDRLRVRLDPRLRLRQRAARDGPAGARAQMGAVLVQRRRRDRPAAGRRGRGDGARRAARARARPRVSASHLPAPSW